MLFNHFVPEERHACVKSGCPRMHREHFESDKAILLRCLVAGEFVPREVCVCVVFNLARARTAMHAVRPYGWSPGPAITYRHTHTHTYTHRAGRRAVAQLRAGTSRCFPRDVASGLRQPVRTLRQPVQQLHGGDDRRRDVDRDTQRDLIAVRGYLLQAYLPDFSTS